MRETILESVSYISIVGMGFIWRLATPSIVDRPNAAGGFTWGNYATKIFNIILQHHPNAIEYHLVNDRYDVELNIKDAEHQKRNSMFLVGSRNIFPSSNLAVPLARNFNSFFGNAKNKIRLQDFQFKELTEFTKNHEKTFVYTLQERWYSTDPVATLHCSFCHQHESDTRMFYHASKPDRRSDISSIAVDAEDADVAVIVSYASFKFEKELLLYRKKKILLCKQLCPGDMSSVIISLHALTGADAVSGFYGHSKKAIYEKVKKSEEAKQLITILGMHGILSEEDIKKCSLFLINFIYADKTSLTISQARSKKWKAMKNKTALRLPPDEYSFEQHLLRANYQAQIWYNFANPDAPSNPLDYGYTQEGLLVLQTLRTKEAWPISLRDLVHDETFESDDDESNDERRFLVL